MQNPNRKYTKALEKSALAKERLADAEQTIAEHLEEFLDDIQKSEVPGEQKNCSDPSLKKEPRK
jgi:hypothetical protein